MLPPPYARDVLDALRLLEGRLLGTGRRLSPWTLELRAFAERSLVICGDHPGDCGAVCSDDEAVMLDLLTYDEVADRLRVAEVTVRRLVRDGRLPAVSVGRSRRVRPADLATFIAGLAAHDKET